MNRALPPGQRETTSIPRWNIDHPGIIPKNPKINLKKWTLIVDGAVENPLELSWQDFLRFPSIEIENDFHCVEGWSVRNCRWYGVRFNYLVSLVKPHVDVSFVSFRCSDGYMTSLDIEDLLKADVLLSSKLNGEWLESSIGGPLRLIVPEKYAYKSAMWIEKITFTIREEQGYWEKRGYSKSAEVWRNDRFAKNQAQRLASLL